MFIPLARSKEWFHLFGTKVSGMTPILPEFWHPRMHQDGLADQPAGFAPLSELTEVTQLRSERHRAPRGGRAHWRDIGSAPTQPARLQAGVQQALPRPAAKEAAGIPTVPHGACTGSGLSHHLHITHT